MPPRERTRGPKRTARKKPQSLPQDLLLSIIESLPARIFWKDRESRYLGCNTLFAKDAGFDQTALDEAARQGFANGAFEELDEDGPAVVEEFFPDEQGVVARPNGAAPKGLSVRLQEKVAIASTG